MSSSNKLHPLMKGLIPTVLLTSGSACGEMLTAGAMGSELSDTLANHPELSGAVEAKNLIPFTLKDDAGNNVYTGHILHEVVRDSQSGCLNFYYRFMNHSNDAFGVQEVIASQFSNFTTDVIVLSDSQGEASPVDALRGDDGSDLTFDFDSMAARISAGGNSTTFIVKTNATDFDSDGNIDIHAFTAESREAASPMIDGGEANVSAFRPVGDPQNSPISNPPPTLNPTPLPTPTPTPTVAVPLPPPVWTAVPTMIASAMYMRRVRKSAGHG
jgi:hypothetical protein